MKNWYVLLILLMLPFTPRAQGDSLSMRIPFHVWKFETAVCGDLSQAGYSTAVTGMARWKRVGFSAGPKIVLNHTYQLREAPAGIVTGFYFFPNGDGERFTAFMNLDYQATFNSEESALRTMFRPGNIIHEYTAGYGFRCRMGKHVRLVSAVNIGRYTQVLYNPVLHMKSSYSGFNTMLRVGVNYAIAR